MRRVILGAVFGLFVLISISGCSSAEKPVAAKSNSPERSGGSSDEPLPVRDHRPFAEPSAPRVESPRVARPAHEIAYDIMLKDMGDSGWKKFVAGARDQYATWERDNPSGNIKIFLDDRLLQIAPSVPGGHIPVLKKFMMYLALYREFSEPPPKYIRDIKEKHKQALEDLLADFSWEKASDMVRKKSAEYPPEERAKLNESMKRRE